MLIDTHAHLSLDHYKFDRAKTIERAKEAGVSAIVEVGINIENSRRAIKLAREYPFIFASVGVHPHDAVSVSQDFLIELEKLLNKPKVVALGEIGLDFYRNYSPQEIQIDVFVAQLELASELKKPVIIHTRNAMKKTIEILTPFKGKLNGVFHSFSGDRSDCKWAIDNGFLIGINGTITFKGTHLDYLDYLPAESILLETDCPYLAPHPYRGKRNEPAYIVYTAERLARITGIGVQELIRITGENAKRLFKISLLEESQSVVEAPQYEDFKPKRALGQNFLSNDQIAERIALLSSAKDKTVVEIGCGHGELTRHLVRIARYVYGIEIDEQLCPQIQDFQNFKLIRGDFLRLKLKELTGGKKAVVVGNIPYSITTPILHHLAAQYSDIDSATLMLQKEAARRIFSQPNTKEYGISSVLVQNYFDWKILMELPPHIFSPQPSVSSLLVRLSPKEKPIVATPNFEEFKRFLKILFSTRRKTILNSLKSLYPVEEIKLALERLSLSTFARPEELSIQELGEIAKYLALSKGK